MGAKIYNVGFKSIRIGQKFPKINNLIDNFDESTLDMETWEVIDPQNSGAISIVNGALNMRLQVGSSASYGYTTTLVRSKTRFPVGTRYRARARNVSGSSATLIGFGNDNTTMHVRGDGELGCSWYSRNTYGSTAYDNVFPSLTDENDQKIYEIDESGPINTYSILEIKRVNSTVLEFYKDDVLLKTVTDILFDDDYSVFFGITNSSGTWIEMDIDWVEVIVP